jgi:hypothetical protein
MPNAILNVGQTGGQVNISTAAAPATPAVGVVTLYAGTDKALHALNSDGTDITIAAAGAASPITVQQTNSLVSTAIGATAGTGQNCAIVIGNNACVPSNAGDSSIVIGKSARHTTYGSESIAIGSGAYVTNSNVVSIGCGAGGESQGGVNIGQGSCTVCNNGIGNIALGRTATAYGALVSSNPFADIAIGNGAVARGGDSLAMGQGTFACENKSISIGGLSKVFPGATGTIVLGNSSVGGTGACNSVVIGNSARTTCLDSIAVGLNSSSAICNGIAIGKNAKAVSGSAGGQYGIVIGTSACTTTGYLGGAIIIGNNACASSDQHVVIGSGACSTGSNYSVVIGVGARGGADDIISIGRFANPSTLCSIAIGKCAISNQTAAISIGPDTVACHTGSVALGSAITTVRTNTTHVNSLVAFGQAASLTNAVGSTGGSVTLNWDNSNIQTLTLTSNITTLTKSNPIDGAVYTLFLTQGGTGGKTVSWGADVDWPSGTAPTLSTAAGAVDAVSLIYIAGVTGYYGNANLNFS